MNANKLISCAETAVEHLKGADLPVMRKRLQMTDTLYRRSRPSESIFESRVSCDFDMCLWTLAAVSAALLAVLLVYKSARHLSRSLCRICHAHGKR